MSDSAERSGRHAMMWVYVQVPLLGGTLALPVAVAMIGRQFGGWGPVAVALRILGVLAVLAAIALFREAKRVLGPALVPTPMPVATATLRQDGVFGTVRHPTYLAIIVGTLGWALTWDSLPDLACAVLCSAFFIAKIQYEEGLLRDRFPEYDAYQRRVPALLPWPRR